MKRFPALASFGATLALVLAIVGGLGTGVGVAFAAGAPKATARTNTSVTQEIAPSTTDCYHSSASVILSAPLRNASTGVASWNYGYVQLWFSYTCGTNWTRLVANMRVQEMSAGVASTAPPPNDGAYAACAPMAGACTTSVPAVLVTGLIYSPNDPASSIGQIYGINSDGSLTCYQASVMQSGAPPPGNWC